MLGVAHFCIMALPWFAFWIFFVIGTDRFTKYLGYVGPWRRYGRKRILPSQYTSRIFILWYVLAVISIVCMIFRVTPFSYEKKFGQAPSGMSQVVYQVDFPNTATIVHVSIDENRDVFCSSENRLVPSGKATDSVYYGTLYQYVYDDLDGMLAKALYEKLYVAGLVYADCDVDDEALVVKVK